MTHSIVREVREESATVRAWVPNRAGVLRAPLALHFARLGGVAQPVPSGDVYVLDYCEEVLGGCVDKMADQIGPFPGVSKFMAYIPEALSFAPRFWKMSSPA